ncbi:ATP-binding protein [Roseomonas mucosa]|uniref:ATP-binding protein n=1 Tax=Roseomonas mucosa TaxID=207340 RepID=UPI0028CC2365|nr:ATP-binding protein [Roseomonas mucosa]MDT8353884.1 ATP-binding protein [Roseomonas mucosa]
MADQLSFNLSLPPDTLVQLWTPDEIYDRLDQQNINKFVEDRRVERKGPLVTPKVLAEYLSMWSNTQPHGGIIIVGVEDDGKITGLSKISSSQKNNLESLSGLCPDARWASKELKILNSNNQEDFVLVYRVTYRPDKVVETSGGDAFIREGDKKIRINEALKRELRISKGEIHYELETVSLKYPADFDLPEIDDFCKQFYINRRYQTEKTREELLELAKLGKRNKEDFLPNLACALLFARDPRDVIPGARIRVIRYEGSHEKFGGELNSVFSTFVDGNISKILFEAKPIIASQLRSFQRFTASGRIVVQQEYPEEAWFEAVVNAVAHRSYNLKTQNIFVKIFDDKFVVESPGGFVPPTTATTVYDAHNPRNPYLMEAMMHLELTFCGFEGTRRMRQAMQSAKLPEPRFRQIEAHSHQVHVTLENDINTRRSISMWEIFKNRPASDVLSLTEDEKAIVEFLTSHPDINITTASLITGKSWPTANKTVSGLVEKGFIEPSSKAKKFSPTKTYKLKVRPLE